MNLLKYLEKYLLQNEKGIIFFSVLLIIFFSILKFDPIIIASKLFAYHEYGALDRYIANVISKIKSNNQSLPLPVWQNINPSTFFLVNSVIFKITNSHVILQVFHTTIHALGLIFFYKNIEKIFNRKTALVSILIYSLSPISIFYSGTIHEVSFNFFFINLFVLYTLNYKINKKTNLVIFFILTYLACSNYWSGFLFTQIYLIYIFYYKKEFSLPYFVVLFPIIIFLFHILFIGTLFSPYEIIEKFIGRSIDLRIGTNFQGVEKIITIKKVILYPVYVDHRLRTMCNIGIIEILTLFLICKFNKLQINHGELLVCLLLASNAWYLIFPQHTLIHRFSGYYAYFGIITSYVYFMFLILENFYRINFRFRSPTLIIICALGLILIFNIISKLSIFSQNYTSAHSQFKTIKKTICLNKQNPKTFYQLNNASKFFNNNVLKILNFSVECN